jgi:hypothetical protein
LPSKIGDFAFWLGADGGFLNLKPIDPEFSRKFQVLVAPSLRPNPRLKHLPQKPKMKRSPTV